MIFPWKFILIEDGWHGVWQCTRCGGYLPDDRMDSELKRPCPYPHWVRKESSNDP